MSTRRTAMGEGELARTDVKRFSPAYSIAAVEFALLASVPPLSFVAENNLADASPRA
jgi:hypothetical protein